MRQDVCVQQAAYLTYMPAGVSHTSCCTPFTKCEFRMFNAFFCITFVSSLSTLSQNMLPKPTFILAGVCTSLNQDVSPHCLYANASGSLYHPHHTLHHLALPGHIEEPSTWTSQLSYCWQPTFHQAAPAKIPRGMATYIWGCNQLLFG